GGYDQSRKRTGFNNSFKCSLFSVFKSGGRKCHLNTCKGNGSNCTEDEDNGDQGLDSLCDSGGGLGQITNVKFTHACASEPGICEGSILAPGGYGIGLIQTSPLTILV